MRFVKNLQITQIFMPALLFVFLLLVFFNKMAFSNLILARGDTFLYFYPYWQAAAEALQDGRVPLWNSQLFMGAPFLANSQVGFFYPLNWPVWWFLETPYAVSASILIHLLIAGLGAYFAGRWLLGLDRWAGLVTAVLFALGGYVTAQVEHVNQLQGIAWLPWYWVVIGWCSRQSDRSRFGTIGLAALAFAFLFSMQLLAGHTQTIFISGVALIIWLIAELASAYLMRNTDQGLRFSFRAKRLLAPIFLALLLSGILALLITAVQLLPTLELTQYSSRQGGLPANEVLSFSLHPLLLARTFLPAYGQSMFSEYVAFLPVTAVILAVIGGWQWRRWPGVFPAVALVLLGLFLALGVFNPLNWVLARLPVFNLFRVPARWLLIVTFGLSLLAGAGFQTALDRYHQRSRSWPDVPERAKVHLAHIERPLRVGIFIIIGLMAWNALAGLLAIFVPVGPEAPFEQINLWTLLFWTVEIVLVYMLLMGERPAYDADGRFKIGLKRTRPPSPLWLLLIIIVSLFFASRSQPYNNLTTPEAYFDLRPPITRLQAAQTANDPFRFLSLSDIFFDVGDQAEIDTIYQDQLSEEARYDYTVAIKQKEILGPNLPMAYGLHSVDGFDGGILPLRSYTELMSLILPDGAETTDGRLRENLTAVPDAKWLDLFNARYIITDKTGDAWRTVGFSSTDVFFDLQHTLDLDNGQSFAVARVPDFTATTLYLLSEGEPGLVEVTTNEGETWQLTPIVEGSGLVSVGWPLQHSRQPFREALPERITFNAQNGAWRILAATLVNQADGTFMPLTLGNYQQVHSGDVKIYENLDSSPLAFMVYDWQWQPDNQSTIAAMKQPDFDPKTTAVLTRQDPFEILPTGAEPAETAVEIINYTPGQITLKTETDAAGMLVLTEAYYPGWQVMINGEEAELLQTDGYFQGVFLPSGEHEVVFAFEPESFAYGRVLSLFGLFLSLIMIIILMTWRRLRRSHS